MTRVTDLEDSVNQGTLPVSTMLRSIVEPADGWPRVSQLTGMSCRVYMIFMSSQGTTGVATSVMGTAARKASTRARSVA